MRRRTVLPSAYLPCMTFDTRTPPREALQSRVAHPGASAPPCQALGPEIP